MRRGPDGSGFKWPATRRRHLIRQMGIGVIARLTARGVGEIRTVRGKDQPEKGRVGQREIDIAQTRRHQLRARIGGGQRLAAVLGGKEAAEPFHRQRGQQPPRIAEMMGRCGMADARALGHGAE